MKTQATFIKKRIKLRAKLTRQMRQSKLEMCVTVACGQRQATFIPKLAQVVILCVHIVCQLVSSQFQPPLGAASSTSDINHNQAQAQFRPQSHHLAAAAAAAKLEAPQIMLMGQPMAEGPGVDLVAFNKRRFELDHEHAHGASSDQELRRGQSIEADLKAISSRLLEALPSDTRKQLLETVNIDQAVITGLTTGIPPGITSGIVSGIASGALLQSEDSSDDPDGASIARLTKSCLTVHASSARPDQLDVKFYLYTKDNPNTAHVLTPHVTRLDLIKGSPFNPSKPIKWITHGFHTNVDKSEWMVEAKDRILQFEDANVILTDWRRGASPALAFYPKAAANAHVVAKFIVRILRRLKEDVDFNQVHLIGHSLGAHIMGFVGSAFTEEHLMRQQQLLLLAQRPADSMFWRSNRPSSSQLIGRITACDPALPCFGPSSSGPVRGATQTGPATTYRDSELSQKAQSFGGTKDAILIDSDWTPSMWTHLRPDSAIIVEVMHSNPGVMGYADPLGDFDFYPNGFERQPGCGTQSNEANPGKARGAGQTEAGGLPVGRAKRQWNSVYDGFMSTVVRPFVAASQPSELQSSLRKSSARSEQPSRLTQTLDKFLHPIKSFFKGNTCSHHRSVEYMVESLYYDRVPQDRKLDKDFVCQMVGYRCQDYVSFKKGFCFRCLNELDCRAFGMTLSAAITDPNSATNRQANHQFGNRKSTPQSSGARNLNLLGMNKFRAAGSDVGPENHYPDIAAAGASLGEKFLNITRQKVKRVLPTFDHYDHNYQAQARNQYFFDTRASKSFCLHHYHIFVKYRWFRVRDNILLSGFRLSGTLANLTRDSSVQLHKFTHDSFTALLSEPVFLGQIESLNIFGAKIKPTLIDYIEITFMSNLDPRVRALGSAKLCRSSHPSDSLQATNDQLGDHLDGKNQPATNSLFVRCSGVMV